MRTRYNLRPPVTTDSLRTPVKSKQLALKRIRSQRGDQTTPYRSSLRLKSTRTALLTLNHGHRSTKSSEACASRTPLAVLLAPLSKAPCASHTSTSSRKGPGSVTSTHTSLQTHTFERTNRLRKYYYSKARRQILRHSPRPRESAIRDSSTTSLRTKLLLRYARQVLQRSTSASSVRPRRPRFVMDVLLDLKALENSEDVFSELFQDHQSNAWISTHTPAEEYPTDRLSLDTGNWTEQHANCAGCTCIFENGISTRFPESFERSTAYYTTSVSHSAIAEPPAGHNVMS